ncbi:MAG: hypothetical protein ACPG7F_03625 [Aggregatilineales bacterium]
MPTPFTHLNIAQKLENDPQIPENIRQLLKTCHPAYLAGSIVADAKPTPESDRDVTHFYRYDRPMADHPWRVMMQQNPSLMTPDSPAHRVFIAAYVAHLAADEYWSKYMLKPHFAEGDWGEDIRDRFFVLHLLLIHMDERDLNQLPIDYAETLPQVNPTAWMPFLPDTCINEWCDFVALQIPDKSETLHIFGTRVKTAPEKLRAMVDDVGLMQIRLWQYLPQTTLADLEAKIYDFAREQMLVYLDETAS